MTDSIAKMTQERDKKYFDKSRSVEYERNLGDFVFVDVFDGQNTKANECTQAKSKELQPRTNGAFKVTFVQFHTVTLDKDGLDNTVFYDRVVLAKRTDEVDHIEPTAKNNP